MKFNQVLVVYKQLSSPNEAEKTPTKGQKLHLETLDALYPFLRQLGVSFESCSTMQLKTLENFDLVITVGGDGTILTASHFVDNQPIVGIKSFGHESVGYFCAANSENMSEYLTDVFQKKLEPKLLHRLEVTINNHPTKELALNDILFAHANPASTTRYSISIGKKEELQRSSGIWISSAAGSTAAVASAGGRVLPAGSKKMEYIVREPYMLFGKYKLRKGVVDNTKNIKIISHTNSGTIYIDGSHIQYPAPEGTEISIQGAKNPLKIYWNK